MKRFALVSGICLSFVLGAVLSAAGQDEHPSERPPNAPQEPKETRPEPAQHPEQPQAPEKAQQQDRQQDREHPQQQARPDDQRNQQPESGNRRNMTPESEQRQQTEQRDQQSGDRHMQGRETHENGRTYEGHPENGQQRAGLTHEGEQRRISDTDFHAHFGREHHFAPRVLQPYQGKPSFAYGGYTFVLVDAWPSQWVYDDDDYYIDYVDGEYWMYNVLYPGARVMVMIVG